MPAQPARRHLSGHDSGRSEIKTYYVRKFVRTTHRIKVTFRVNVHLSDV